ncbi:major facilitator superfamily domain-containing protein [Ilyonectria robusta]|uniref:major facilitator superfamily domain-containing protein n=1 Tax=Ilyonectria robusta TaxID=1079257 RepID=UPI001E8D66D1|nr:major facilitator superfamily domain-containing protein [Ilyonectria robusta]KAH8734144.1 major facilitator superfamily domain-containing protein [Ilyonectria robusta]
MDTTEKKEDGPEYPDLYKRVIIMVSLYLAMFLIILDGNVLSTAIPRITDEFDSISDIGWYGSAYLLTTCTFQLLMGKIYKFYPAKPVFLAGITIFEIGSAICGAAPNSKALIVGRAVAGLGSSGLFSGVMVIMFNTIPLQERPIWQGGIGGVLTLGSVIGPLLGGVFTDKVTWRWCFYINLPVGAVSILVAIFVVKLPKQTLDKPADGWTGKFKQLDPIGNFCFFPGVVCLILALQWGGTTYPWSDARIIVLIVICVVMVVAFIGIQIWKQEDGSIPPRLVKQRSIAAATFYSFFNGGGMMIISYYLPIWFQAIKNVNATKSGIMLLPLILSTIIGTISSGIIISRTGYNTPFFLLSSVMMPIGAGLISTFTPTTGAGKWISYQIILGIGFGFGVQQPMNVVQTILDRADIATGSALVTFVRFLASAVFLPVAQNIFLNTLVKKLTNLPGIDPKTVTGGGATELRSLVSSDDLKTLLADYNVAIRNVSFLAIATCAITILGSVFVEWHNLKDHEKEQEGSASTAEQGKSEVESSATQS